MKALIAATILLITSTASAQHYISDAHAPRPVGATGPGVQHTRQIFGTVISVGSPIVRNVPIGQICPQQYQQTQQEHSSALNGGAVIGAIAGGILGSQVGGGRGRDAAIATGAAVGAVVGSDVNRRLYTNPNPTGWTGGCQTQFEQRIVGFTYVAEVQGIQVTGQMARQPQVGERVPIIMTTTYYAGSL